MVAIDPTIRRMITSGESMDTIFAYAREKQGMSTLRDSIRELVRSGVTTVEEMVKLTYFAE